MVRLPDRIKPLWPYLKATYTVGTRMVAPVTIRLSTARGGHLPTGVVDTMEEAAATTGGRCWTVRPEELVVRPIPEGHPPQHRAFVDSATETIGRVALAELPGGRVLGQHSAVITGRGDLLQELSVYFGTSRPREHPLFLRPFPPEPWEVPGRLGVLASRGGAVNYYHFLMDVLARVGVAEQCAEVSPPELWYVPAATAYQRELLDLFGITPEQRIDSVEHPHVRAECLVVPGLPATEVKNPAWVVAFLRERLLPDGIGRVPGRRIYVTRGHGRNNRYVVNEDEVVAALASRGFESVDPGTLTVAEQIRVFAEADVIVSGHGAALANLLFASPGALVVELFPLDHMVPDYWKLACGVPGLEYRYLAGVGATGKGDRTAMLVSDITVDLPALVGMIDAR